MAKIKERNSQRRVNKRNPNQSEPSGKNKSERVL